MVKELPELPEGWRWTAKIHSGGDYPGVEVFLWSDGDEGMPPIGTWRACLPKPYKTYNVVGAIKKAANALWENLSINAEASKELGIHIDLL